MGGGAASPLLCSSSGSGARRSPIETAETVIDSDIKGASSSEASPSNLQVFPPTNGAYQAPGTPTACRIKEKLFPEELIQRGPTPEPLCQVMLRVGELERSIKFYEKIYLQKYHRTSKLLPVQDNLLITYLTYNILRDFHLRLMKQIHVMKRVNEE